MADWTSLLAPGSRKGQGGQNDYIARMLMEQSAEPIQSPFQGLAHMAQAYVAKQRMDAGREQGVQGNQALADILAPASQATPAGQQQSAALPNGGTVDYQNPALPATADPKNAQIAALLNGGIGQEQFTGQALDQLGFGKPQSPLKGSPGDVFFDPKTHAQIPGMSVPTKPDKPEATPDSIQIAHELYPNDPKKQAQYLEKNSPSNLRSITNINNPRENWQILTDPKTNSQYRYDPSSARATTLDGQPYVAGGAQKIGGGGMPRSPAAAFINKYMEAHPNATSEEISKQAASFRMGQSEGGTIGTRSGAADVASQEVTVFAKQALDASAALPRSQYALFNQAMQSWDTKTSNPQLRKLMIAADALVNARARAISPTGSPHVNDQLEGRKMLSAAFASGDFEGAVEQMQMEADGVRASTKASQDDFMGKPHKEQPQQTKKPTVSNW